MVDTHQTKDSCVQIVDVHTAIDRGHAEFVGTAVTIALSDSGSGHEHRIAGDIVIAAIRALCGGQASELGAEEDQGVFKQTALLEIREQCGRGLRAKEPSSPGLTP